jgi:hypothetical protein
MPAAVPMLAAIGGGSALAGGAAVAGLGASLYGANRDRSQQADNQQQSAQERAQALQYIQQQTGQAQDYLANSYAPMQGALNQGYSGALQALAGGFAPRMNAITQSAQDAQRFQIGSLPFVQQALMGVPINLADIAPRTQKANIQYDPGIAYNFVQKYGPQG